jgi:Fe-S-cluster containining protein
VTNSCSQCGACCKLFLINLSEKEYRSGKYKTQFGKSVTFKDFKKAASCGAATLKQKPDGSCIYLKNNHCSIHKTRPEVCRGFFCSSKLSKYQTMIQEINNYKATVKNKLSKS